MSKGKPVDNRHFDTPVFRRACELASIPPTKRQASKWRNGKGLARRFMTAAILILGKESRQ